MNINICTLDPEGKIKKSDWALIKTATRRNAEIVCNLLSINVLNITIYPNKDWCIKETGDGGYTASSDWIQLFIDPSKQISKILKTSFPATLYHETSHARRMFKVGFGKTLLETIISEGLAIVFAEEMFKDFVAPWGKYTYNEVKKFYKTFLPHKDEEKFSYEEWFLGFGRPHWLGYKLGTYIIRELKQNDKEFNSIKMVDIPASKIYEAWYNSNASTNLK